MVVMNCELLNMVEKKFQERYTRPQIDSYSSSFLVEMSVLHREGRNRKNPEPNEVIKT